MTIQYTLDISHSTLLTSKQNADLVSCIKDTILNDVGLANLNKSIQNQDIVSEVLKFMALIVNSNTRNRQYLFNAQTGEHIFYISEGSVKLPAKVKDIMLGAPSVKLPTKVKDMLLSIPKDRTSIRYYRDDKLFIMQVNSRFYPLSGVTKITTTTNGFNNVFSGPLFIRRTSEKRFIPDSKELWELRIPEFKQMIADTLSVIYTDLKRKFHSELTPPDALFITETMFENLHTLMVLLRINHNLPKYEAKVFNEQLLMEALETSYNKYSQTKDGVDFTYIAIFMTGKLLERLVKSGYQHLLKGVLHGNGK